MELKSFFAKHKLPKRARAHRHREQPHRRPHDRARRHRRREAARERRPLPRPGGAADPDRRGRARLPGARPKARATTASPTRRVLLVVAYRDLVDGYERACKLAGLRLAGIDLEAFALAARARPGGAARRAIEAPWSPSPSAAERSTLAVSDGITCEFTRVLEWGGASLTAALARSLEIDLVEAERLKTLLSLEDVPGVVQGLTEEQTTQARRGAARRPAGLRAGARLLAPVLPEPAGLAGHPRDRSRGRRGPAAAASPRRSSASPA